MGIQYTFCIYSVVLHVSVTLVLRVARICVSYTLLKLKNAWCYVYP